MALRSIIWHPDPVLQEVCEPVTVFDEELRALVRDMAQTMYAAPGVGLAAPQVNVTKRVFVIDVRDQDPTGSPVLRAFINPEIVKKEGSLLWEEGCLSIPGITEEIARAEKVTVQAYNELGEPFELTVDGLLGIAIQHENDHLDGVLMFDRMSPLKRKFALRRYKKELERLREESEEAAAR